MQVSPRAAAVVLAAGASRRFGSPKQLATLGGVTMLERVVEAARGSRLAPIVVVLPPDLDAPAGTVAIVNRHPEHGLARSLQLGFAAVPAHALAAVVLLGDQPTVTPAEIDALLSHRDAERPVVATRAEGRIGPPLLLRRAGFSLVGEARGDSGLAPVLARHGDLVAYVDSRAHLPDVDSPPDLEALREAIGDERGG